MLTLRKLLRFVAFLFCAVLVYFLFDQFLAKKAPVGRRTQRRNEEIVAFSLSKQIQIDSKRFRCGDFSLKGPKAKSKRWMKIEGTNVFVYSAYRDRRLHPFEYLRVIAMVKGSWTQALYCQTSSKITRATYTKIWTKTWGQNDTQTYYNPYLISCHVPTNTTNFALSPKACKQTNPVQTIPLEAHTQTNSFTLCVKPLNFRRNITDRILQWLTINKLLGASHFHIYYESVHDLDNLKRVERIFNGTLVLERHQALEQTSNLWQKRRYEIITYNDCFYRHIHTSRFVVPLDVDEIIVPRRVSTWLELFPSSSDKFASYTVRNAYYLRQFNPKKLQGVFFFNDVVRSAFSQAKESCKSFVSTRNALTVFNHYALKKLRPEVLRFFDFGTDVVQMNHYRDGCNSVILPQCDKYLSSPVAVDDIILRYKEEFFNELRKLMKLFLSSL